MKYFFGFSTQEEYDYYLDLVKGIVDNYCVDDFNVTKDNDCIYIYLDKCRISVWDSETVELYSEDKLVYTDYINCLYDIKTLLYEDNFFYEEETEE